MEPILFTPTVLMRLKRHMNKHPLVHVSLAHHGDIDLNAQDTLALKNIFTFDQPSSKQTPDALLITFHTTTPDILNTYLTRHPTVQLVFIYIPPDTKKTPLYVTLESHRYRLLHEEDTLSVFWRPSETPSHSIPPERFDSLHIQKFLEKSARYLRHLPPETHAISFLASPASLLTSPRFDIAIKAHYARLYLNDQAKEWRDYCYKEHAARITGPGPDIVEYDGTEKHGLKAFLDQFHQLLVPIPDPRNIPAVPVDRSLVAMDGAHRIAAAIAMNRPVHTVQLDTEAKNRADADFFLNSPDGHPLCPIEILDEAAIEYCRIKDGLALAVVFPSAGSDKTAIHYLEGMSKIVYKKTIIFSPSMGERLLHQIYYGHSFMNPETNSDGFLHKIKSCFPFTGPLHVLLIDDFDPRDLRNVKEKIRNAYGIGNHSIHITDSDDETLRAARVLFNENSLDFLRTGIRPFPSFHEKLTTYKKWIDENGLEIEHFSIGGSGLLGLFGLRNPNDIDFIYHGDSSALPPLPDMISPHDYNTSPYPHSVPDIIGDPRRHGWYMDMKFCAPDVILRMKKARNETKDRSDIFLLQSYLPRQGNVFLKETALFFHRFYGLTRVFLARTLGHIKKPLRPFVRHIRRYLGQVRS